MAQLLVAGLFAIAFGTIYVLGTWEAIELAIECAPQVEGVEVCKKVKTDIPHLSYVLTTIGNMISGSIVGVLALTRKNEFPAERLLNGDKKDIAKTIAMFIPLAFIILWVACGVATVIFGLFKYPEVIPPLTAQAKGWLGSAGTALLAYLAPAPGGTPPPTPDPS